MNFERGVLILNIKGKFRWENTKDGGDPVATGEIPLIIYNNITYQFPEMLRLIDKTGEWDKMFEGVSFKYKKIETGILKKFFFGEEEGNYDWEIEIDDSVYSLIEVYKHPVPIHLNAPIKVF